MSIVSWRRRVPQRDGTPEGEGSANPVTEGSREPSADGETMTAAQLWSVPGWAQLRPSEPVLSGFPFTIDREFVRALPARQKPYLALETLDHVVSSAAPGGVIEDLLVPTADLVGDGPPRTPPDMRLRPAPNRRPVRSESVAPEGSDATRPQMRFGDEPEPAPLEGEVQWEPESEAPGVELPVVAAEAPSDRYDTALDVAVQRPTSLRVLPTPSPEEWTTLLGADRATPKEQLAAPTEQVRSERPLAVAPDLQDERSLEGEAQDEVPPTVPMEIEQDLDEPRQAAGEATPAVPTTPAENDSPADRAGKTLPLAMPEGGQDETTRSATAFPPAAPLLASSPSPDPTEAPKAVRRAGLGSPLTGLPQSAVSVGREAQKEKVSPSSVLPLAGPRPDRGGGEVELGSVATPAVPAMSFRDAELAAPRLPGLEDLSFTSTDVPVVVPLPFTPPVPPMPLAPQPVGRTVEPEDSVRQEVEGRLGVDLSGVHVDRGPAVAGQARSLGAEAFTDAQGVHIPASTGSESSAHARGLLAHELTHAAQRRRLHGRMPDEDSPAGRRLEAEAVAVERSVAAAPGAPPRGPLPLAQQPGLPAPDEGGGASSTGTQGVRGMARAALATLGLRRTASPQGEQAAEGPLPFAYSPEGTTYTQGGGETYAEVRTQQPTTVGPGVLTGIAPWEEATPTTRIGAPSEASIPSLAVLRPNGGDTEADRGAAPLTASGVLGPGAGSSERMLVTEQPIGAAVVKRVEMPVATPPPADPAAADAVAAILGQSVLGFDPTMGAYQPTAGGMGSVAGSPSAQAFGSATWTPATANAGPAQSTSGLGGGFGGGVQRKPDEETPDPHPPETPNARDQKTDKRMTDGDVDVLVDQILPVITYRLRSELRRERDSSGSLTGFF